MSTLYWAVYPSAQSAPTADQIKNGTVPNGIFGQDASPTIDTIGFLGSFISGLDAETSYRIAGVWSDGSNDSNVNVSDPFVTPAVPTQGNIRLGSTPIAKAYLGAVQLPQIFLGEVPMFSGASGPSNLVNVEFLEAVGNFSYAGLTVVASLEITKQSDTSVLVAHLSSNCWTTTGNVQNFTYLYCRIDGDSGIVSRGMSRGLDGPGPAWVTNYETVSGSRIFDSLPSGAYVVEMLLQASNSNASTSGSRSILVEEIEL